MKLIIDIPELTYDRLLNEQHIPNMDYKYLIIHGTPIPDNATNGDVIKAVFQQWKILDYADKDMIMFNIPMKVGCEFNACSREWWNAPYQKGGK